MSATSFNFSVIIIPSTLYSDPSNPGFQTLNKSLSFALEISSPQDFTTLHSQDSSRGSTYNGLLYVPDLDPDDPCDNPAIVPRNATRRENLPMDDLKLIAYAPLTTPHCCRQYMSSANNDYVSAFIFYGVASNYSNGTNPLRNEAFDVDYPVYYLDGSIGQPLMGKLSEYSGNMSELYNQASLEAAGYDLRDFARIYAVISTRGSNPMPGLWLFLLVVVAVLLFIIGASSLLMHLCQFHYRRSLRRRIANGEVDLEGLGIGRITVPREFLVKFPTYTYTAEESTAEGPRTPAVAAGPPRMEGSVEPKTPSKAAGSTNTSTSTNMNMNTSTSTSTNTNASASEAAGRAHLGRYSQTGCPICLEDFVREETRVRELPCGHVFHPECIDPYLETQSSLCVLCKQSCLPKGYVPIRLTNAIVRRERLLRRVRAHSRMSSSAAMAGRHGSSGREMVESGGMLFRWRLRRLRRQELDLVGREALSRASARGGGGGGGGGEHRSRGRGGVPGVGRQGSGHGRGEVVEDVVRPRWRETMDRIFPGFR